LLLLTNDGELAHKLMHPSYEVPRVYLALVRGDVRRPTLDALRAGVELEDGLAQPRSVHLADSNAGRTLLQITLTEGRNREVRRLIGAVGLMLERLARVGYAGVELGELRQGKWRFLTQPEVGRLFAAVDGGPAGRPGRPPRGPARRGRR
jgi:23S rRNA pseudouridine2605 synthase